MDNTDPHPTHFTTQDRDDLDRLKETVRCRLRQQRAVSELIWETAQAMYEADVRGLWRMDMKPERLPGRRGKKGRCVTRERWAMTAFGMSGRQAYKYFLVAERLAQKEVAGSGLCLDRLEQLALSPVEMRDLIRALGMQGLSSRALSAGRRQGLLLLQQGDTPAALVEVERVARKHRRQEAREDGRKAPPTSPDGVDQVGGGGPEQGPTVPPKGPDAASACKRAQKVLAEVEALSRAPAGKQDLAKLEELVVISAKLARCAEQALDRARRQGEESGPGPKSADTTAATGEPRPAPAATGEPEVRQETFVAPAAEGTRKETSETVAGDDAAANGDADADDAYASYSYDYAADAGAGEPTETATAQTRVPGRPRRRREAPGRACRPPGHRRSTAAPSTVGLKERSGAEAPDGPPFSGTRKRRGDRDDTEP